MNGGPGIDRFERVVHYAPLGRRGHERARVLGLAALVVVSVGGYLAIRSAAPVGNDQQNLLPYQSLTRTLPTAEQRMFRTLREGLVAAEAIRAQTGRWPEAAALAEQGTSPFAASGDEGAPGYSWKRSQDGRIIEYVGIPAVQSDPAWLLMIQEPDPAAPPDRAPNDEEHHRLPDGIALHIYVWKHRYGGQVTSAFVPLPQANGWSQILTAPSTLVAPAAR